MPIITYPTTSGNYTQILYTSNSNFVVPTGVYLLDKLILVGGGGGGGCGNIYNGAYCGGGGAGEIKIYNNFPLFESSYAITIGAGGVGGVGKTIPAYGYESLSTDGGTTYFGPDFYALNGGRGGCPTESIDLYGGDSGTLSNRDNVSWTDPELTETIALDYIFIQRCTGGNGHGDGTDSLYFNGGHRGGQTSYYQSGGGAGGYGGAGGNGAEDNLAAEDGHGYGAGGGGGYPSYNQTYNTGGDGYQGVIILGYFS